MLSRLAKIALSLPFLVAAGLFALYLIFGFFLVNPLAQKLLPWVGENKLASRLSAQQVSFNPLTLEATVSGLKLAEKNGAPLAAFDRLYVNVDTTGILRWAWRIQDIQLDRPQANYSIQPGGKANWSALLAKLNEDKEPPSDSIARVLIEHLKISGGDLRYRDASRPGKPFTLALSPLGIELDGLSTLPEDRGDYLIAAKLPEQGGTLKWKGDVGLNPVASQGELGLEGVRLANLLRAIKSPRNFELPSGTLGAGLRYRFAMVRNKGGDDAPWLHIQGANLLLQDLALAPRGGGQPVLTLKEARLSNAEMDLSKRHLSVAGVRLAGANLTATRAANGTLDWQMLFASDAAPATEAPVSPAAPTSTSSDAPWKIDVREIKMVDWSVQFTDRGFATPLSVAAEGFNLDAALQGELGATPAIAISPIHATLGLVQVRSGTQTVASLTRTALVNAGLNLSDKQLSIDAIELSGLKTRVMLDANKQLNWGSILKKSAAVPVVTAARSDASPALNLKLARLSLDGIEVGITDQSLSSPVQLDLAQGFVTLSNLSLDMQQAVPLKAGFAFKQGGRFDANGAITPGNALGKLDLKLAGLRLNPFAPYVNQFAKLRLRSGAVSSRGKLAFAQAKSGLKLDYDGGFSVDDLAITEEETDEAFLGWKKLASDSLDFSLAPKRLHMAELVAQNPFGKLIIFEDKTLNFKRMVRTSPVQAETPPPAVAQPAAEPAFPLAIARLRIVDANAEFADLSLTPQFGTRMHGLSGVITGLSSDSATTAQVELDGKVDEFGSARVRGSLQPFQATEFTDLKVIFRNLEMANMTPYSGKFAGRRIDSGKLSVDLEYKIKQRQLAGENKFILNKLKLGERVDSPDAMKLPLDLAIALLEDSNGIIDLDLPISGSLDDPQFSYGRIVWKAIVNVLTKLVTAPFRALGKLLGAGSEKMEAVTFDPGSAQLLPPEQEKLKTLADALSKRPALTLTLEPGFDPEVDRRALQERTMRSEAARVAGVRLSPNEAPGPVDVNVYKVQTWLEDQYVERVGKADYQTLRARFKEKNLSSVVTDNETVERLARRFKTRDPGAVSALHTELLEQLTQKTVIDDAALKQLAQARGQAMREGLLQYGLVAGRVSVAAPTQQTAKDKQVGSKLSLGAGKAVAPSEAPAR